MPLGYDSLTRRYVGEAVDERNRRRSPLYGGGFDFGEQPIRADLPESDAPSFFSRAGGFLDRNRREAGVLATAGIGLYSRLKNSKYQQMLEEVADDQLAFRSELARHRRGQFTPRETRQIREAHRGRLNRIAGDVAARGLGTSGAGARVIAEAQQLPFLHAQTAATQALSSANEAAFNLAAKMRGSDSFTEDFAKVIGNLVELRGSGDDVRQDGVVAQMFEWLRDQWESLETPETAPAATG